MIRCMPGILVIRHLIMQLSLSPKVSWLARIPFGMETFHSPRKNLGYVHTIPDRFSVRLGNRSDTMWTVLGEIGPDRTGLELSCSHHIGSIFVLVSQKQTYPRIQESDNEIRSKNRADPLNRSFTLVGERSKMLSDTERITFGIWAFQLVIVTGIVPER